MFWKLQEPAGGGKKTWINAAKVKNRQRAKLTTGSNTPKPTVRTPGSRTEETAQNKVTGKEF